MWCRCFAPTGHRWPLSSGCVLTSTIGIINPLLIQEVFNKALFVRGGPNIELLVILVTIMAVVPMVNGAIGILQTYETTRVGQLVMRDLRDRLYSHLQTLLLAFFTGTKTGEIHSLSTSRSVIAASLAMSKPRNAARNASRLPNTIDQLSPTSNTPRVSASNIADSSSVRVPQTSSW